MDKQKIKKVGCWCNDSEIELVKIDDEIFALNGWNGESYLDCWKVNKDDLTEVVEDNYIITPYYNVEGDGVYITDYKLSYYEIYKN